VAQTVKYLWPSSWWGDVSVTAPPTPTLRTWPSALRASSCCLSGMWFYGRDVKYEYKYYYVSSTDAFMRHRCGIWFRM